MLQSPNPHGEIAIAIAREFGTSSMQLSELHLGCLVECCASVDISRKFCHKMAMIVYN